ncbi:GNAT family N-acetyltransferase [Actinoplanes sp. CA-015351]|uniref:GNAT family N-acetyltransferase n=1 Tax=Actinoplanes sp. CA-015351 TaxID=3239897 RepID=UPI003D97E729
MDSRSAVVGASLDEVKEADVDALAKAFGERIYFVAQVQRWGPFDNEVFVARQGEDILGTVTLGPIEEKELRESEPFSKHPSRLLSHLEVPPPQRGRGIGTWIMAEMESRLAARDFRYVVLGVDESNEGAQRLYRKLGYQAWAGSPLRTVKRSFHESCTWGDEPEYCLVYYKDLSPA